MKTGNVDHKNGPRTLLSAAVDYEASLTPEQRAAKPKRFREPTEEEDPFLLEEIEDEENPFAPFTPNPNRARRIVCADGVSRSFALAEKEATA